MINKTDQPSFDPKVFLAKVGEGKTVIEYRKDQIVFAQGDMADTVFISKKAESRLLSYPSKAKKPLLGFWSPASSLAKAA
jgi:CRP/FNR family transcriptional regulator, cyclic AMP receptor protein